MFDSYSKGQYVGIASIDGVPCIDVENIGDYSVYVLLNGGRQQIIEIIEDPPPQNVTLYIKKIDTYGEIESLPIPSNHFTTYNMKNEGIKDLSESHGAQIFRDFERGFEYSDVYEYLYDYVYGLTEDLDDFQDAVNNGEIEEVEEVEEVERANFLESLISRIIISIGTIFKDIIEWVVGASGGLSIDNIIFNRFDQTIIDLSELGGANITTQRSGGIFKDENVVAVISILSSALKILAAGIYIIMLLYIGIKILMSIGSKEQKTYFKYLEYWISGIIILVILPYFLPLIPAMNNALVGVMEQKAQSMYGGYTIRDVLNYLGGDAELLGEDAQIAAVQELIDDRIIELEKQVENKNEQTIAEAINNIGDKKNKVIEEFSDFDETQIELLEEKINRVIDIITNNFKNWTDENENEYREAIQDVRTYIYESANTEIVVNQILNELPEEVSNDSYIMLQVQRILNAIKKDPATYQVSSNLAKELYLFRNVMEGRRLIAYYEECSRVITDARKEYIDYYLNTEAFLNLEKLFSDYKDALLKREIGELITRRNSMTKNVLTILETKVLESGRLVYAIAWLILFDQTFAVLFLYFKRLITIAVLIIIFPLIMIFYIFDKLDDGKAQSLQTWLKEFIANIMVQTFHAALYVVVVNIGIDACNVDPEKNWFILIITISFLFAGEKILRGILGLTASTLNELRNTMMGTKMIVAGTVAATKMTANAIAAVATMGASTGATAAKTAGEIAKKSAKAAEEAKKAEEKAKKIKKAKKRKAVRDKARKIRQDKIAKGKGNVFHVAGEKLSQYKDKAVKAVADNKVIKGVKGVYSKVSSNRVLKLGKKAYSSGKYAVKKGASIFGKAAALTMTAADAIEDFSKDGDFVNATGKVIGAAGILGINKGMNKYSKRFAENQEKESKIKEEDIPKFNTRYSNGTRVKGRGRVSVGNKNPRNNSSNSRIVSNQIRTRLNVNTRTQTNETNDENI